jgi:actin-related protein
LCAIIGENIPDEEEESGVKEGKTQHEARKISFEECEEIMYRLMWCRASAFKSSQRHSAQLETVEEQDESEADASHTPPFVGEMAVPFNSIQPPREVKIPLEKLADTCDEAFFSPETAWTEFDDNELPLHGLIYQHLLHLPVDARAICMSRSMFTGGCSNILGLKERVFDEVNSIVERRGWEVVTGKAVDSLRNNTKLKRPLSTQTNSDGTLTPTIEPPPALDSPNDPAEEFPDPNAAIEASIEAKLAKNRPSAPQIQGELRALHSVGPWAGASLTCQLKTGAVATIDREQWLQYGVAGAARPGEVDHKQQQRQSMGGGGMWRGGAGGHHSSWTLGAWGYL